MFPISIGTYVKLGACALALLFCIYLGYSFEHSRFMAFKAAIVQETARLQEEHQSQADQIRIKKDAQIASINTQLVDAISELRKRPSRAQGSPNGQSGTGVSLSAEDADFLVREAARADTLRAALNACYQQYDSIK